MTTPEEARRAAALAALRTEQRPPQSFWDRHGSRIAAIAAVAGMLLAGVMAVGKFLGRSTSEVSRATDELHRGLRTK